MRFEYDVVEDFAQKVRALKINEVGLKTELFAKAVKVKLPEAKGPDGVVLAPEREAEAQEVTAVLTLSAVGTRKEKILGLAPIDTFELPLRFEERLPPAVILTKEDTEAFNSALEEKKQELINSVEDSKAKIRVFMGAVAPTQHSNFRQGGA